MPHFEVGMPTRCRRWQMQRRIDIGARFLVAGPVLHPATVAGRIGRLELGEGGPPVYLSVIPSFSRSWAEHTERLGRVPIGNGLRREPEALRGDQHRAFAREHAAAAARDAGCAGVILMVLKYAIVVAEAPAAWNEARRVTG